MRRESTNVTCLSRVERRSWNQNAQVNALLVWTIPRQTACFVLVPVVQREATSLRIGTNRRLCFADLDLVFIAKHKAS